MASKFAGFTDHWQERQKLIGAHNFRINPDYECLCLERPVAVPWCAGALSCGCGRDWGRCWKTEGVERRNVNCYCWRRCGQEKTCNDNVPSSVQA